MQDIFTEGFGKASNMANFSVAELLKMKAPKLSNRRREVKQVVARLPREEDSAPLWWRMKMAMATSSATITPESAAIEAGALQQPAVNFLVEFRQDYILHGRSLAVDDSAKKMEVVVLLARKYVRPKDYEALILTPQRLLQECALQHMLLVTFLLSIIFLIIFLADIKYSIFFGFVATSFPFPGDAPIHGPEIQARAKPPCQPGCE